MPLLTSFFALFCALLYFNASAWGAGFRKYVKLRKVVDQFWYYYRGAYKYQPVDAYTSQ